MPSGGAHSGVVASPGEQFESACAAGALIVPASPSAAKLNPPERTAAEATLVNIRRVMGISFRAPPRSDMHRVSTGQGATDPNFCGRLRPRYPHGHQNPRRRQDNRRMCGPKRTLVTTKRLPVAAASIGTAGRINRRRNPLRHNLLRRSRLRHRSRLRRRNPRYRNRLRRRSHQQPSIRPRLTFLPPNTSLGRLSWPPARLSGRGGSAHSHPTDPGRFCGALE